MPHLNRRGFTLVELLIALVLLGIVSAAIYRTLVQQQRINQSQTQFIDLQANIRAAAAILPAEFHELDATDGDIYSMSSTSIKIRAFRYHGILCQAPVLGAGTNGLAIIIRQQPWFGARTINTTTDSLLVRYEGDEGTRMDDAWVLTKPTAVVNGVCPGVGGAAGYIVTANFGLGGAGQPANSSGAIYVGAPVHGFEVVTYALYQSGSDWYLGMTTASAGTQPIIGPLLANGVSFTYYDSTGAVTALTNRVARIDIVLRAQSAQAVRQTVGGGVGLARIVDSLTTSVALRNNKRF